MDKALELSVVIPFFNERDNLPILIKRISTSIEKIVGNVELILVNDGSSDNFIDCIKEKKTDHLCIKLINLSQNYGSHAAIRAGIQHSSGKYIIIQAADLQDPPELIVNLYNKANEGFDIVWAERKLFKRNAIENSFSILYGSLIRKFITNNYPKKGFDVVLFGENIRDILNNNMEKHSSIYLQILMLGFKQTQITYIKKERLYGKSKWTLSKKIKLFLDTFLAFSYTPIRFVTIVGFLFFTLGFAWTVYTILRTLLVGDLAPGWPALVSILMIGFGVTNISLGIIAEYMWRTMELSTKRPTFIIESIEVIRSNETNN